MLDPDVCYRALQSRDERFDGRIFVGVTSTGIYCRPVCPAPSPKICNCRFFPSAAAAQVAGFRPCLRCRPETAPDRGSWRGTSNTVTRGLALIAAGELDGEGATIDGLAERLGVGGRQLRRLFKQHLGATPIAVAQTRRVLFAKQLIHETQLSMADVAFASGFRSVRRFNEIFRKLYGRPPSRLRRANGSPGSPKPSADTGVTVRLRYRAPYDWEAMLAFLRARAIDGIEVVHDGRYTRTIALGEETGSVSVAHAPATNSLAVTIRFPTVGELPAIVARVRRVFDLGADVVAISAQLVRDPVLAPLIAERPGLRAPGGWHGFELAVRAILGQQVTLEAGRKLAVKLVALCGSCGAESDDGLTLVFPTAAQVAGASLADLGMPDARRQTLTALAEAAIDDPHLFQPLATVEDTVARLRAIRGIGEWTAQYIALRAAREPDAFPASDVGLLRAATQNGAARPTPAELLERAERWRPWRAYAAQHLWAADAASRPPPSGARS